VIDSTLKGYNIAGPAGMFVAASEADGYRVCQYILSFESGLQKETRPIGKGPSLEDGSKMVPQDFLSIMRRG